MATAWPAKVIADYGEDKVVSTSAMIALADRDRALMSTPFAIYRPLFTVVVTTLGTAYTLPVFCPDWAVGMYFASRFVVKGQGELRLKWGTSYSSTIAFSYGSTYTVSDLVRVIVSPTADTMTNVVVEARNTGGGGTVFEESYDILSWFEYE